MVLCSRGEREKVYTLFTVNNKNRKNCTEGEKRDLQWETERIYTMLGRDMVLTIGILFSTEEWLGSGSVQNALSYKTIDCHSVQVR